MDQVFATTSYSGGNFSLKIDKNFKKNKNLGFKEVQNICYDLNTYVAY